MNDFTADNPHGHDRDFVYSLSLGRGGATAPYVQPGFFIVLDRAFPFPYGKEMLVVELQSPITSLIGIMSVFFLFSWSRKFNR